MPPGSLTKPSQPRPGSQAPGQVTGAAAAAAAPTPGPGSQRSQMCPVVARGGSMGHSWTRREESTVSIFLFLSLKFLGQPQTHAKT